MESVNVEHLASKLRALGVGLSLDGDRIRCRTLDGRRPSLEAQGLLGEIRALGLVAVDFLKHEAAGVAAAKDQEVIEKPLDKPVGGNQIPTMTWENFPLPDDEGFVRLVRAVSEVALAAGELVKAGLAALVGRVTYHRLSDTFDLTIKVVNS